MYIRCYLLTGSSTLVDVEAMGVSICSAAPESVLVVDCTQDSSMFSPGTDSVVTLLLDLLLIIVSTDLQNLAQALRTIAVSFNGFS